MGAKMFLFNMTELLKYRNVSRELYSGTVNATEIDNKDDVIDVGPFKEATFFLDCSAFVGTTLDVSILTKDPAADKWHEIAAFTQLSAAGNEMKAVAANLGDKIAYVITPVGAGDKTLTLSANFKIM